MEEYKITTDYQTAKNKAIFAILQSLYGIEVQDFNGTITITKNDKRVARITIEESP